MASTVVSKRHQQIETAQAESLVLTMTENADHHNNEQRKLLNQLLAVQYKSVQDYCNAQTKLGNALIEEKDRRLLQETSLKVGIQGLRHALECVRCNLQDLRDMARQYQHHNENQSQRLTDRQRYVLEQHIARSERVLATIYNHGGSYHTNGLPATRDDAEIKMVALATLRSSRKKVMKQLGLTTS